MIFRAPVAKDVGPNDPHGVHAVPRRLLMAVYIALVVCTFLTVGASKVDMGDANIWVVLLIAMVKGGLVDHVLYAPVVGQPV